MTSFDLAKQRATYLEDCGDFSKALEELQTIWNDPDFPMVDRRPCGYWIQTLKRACDESAGLLPRWRKSLIGEPGRRVKA